MRRAGTATSENAMAEGRLMRRYLWFTAAAGVAAFAGAAHAQTAAGELEIFGSSSLHAWTCREPQIRTAADAGAVVDRALAGQNAPEGIAFSFPVGGIDCGSTRMNDRLRRGLKARQYPFITYRLQSYDIGRAIAAGSMPIKVDGQLTIAGRTRPVDMQVTATRTAGGGVRVNGSEALHMTQFGVKPPTMMFGLLKVHDLVRIRFDVLLRAATLAALGLRAR